MCSEDKADLVRSLGADDVIDYARSDITMNGPVYDLVVIVGGESGGRWLGGVDRTIRATVAAPFVRQRLRVFVARERSADFETLGRYIEAGTLAPVVARTYPLRDAADAVRYLLDGQASGKVVVTV